MGDTTSPVPNGIEPRQFSGGIEMSGLQGPPGPQGLKGDKGDKGDTGDPFVYTDFTPEQLEAIRGPQGIQGPKGDKGDPFVYSDFTPAQLEGLRGPQGIQGVKGDQGIQGVKGDKGDQGIQGPVGPSGAAQADAALAAATRPHLNLLADQNRLPAGITISKQDMASEGGELHFEKSDGMTVLGHDVIVDLWGSNTVASFRIFEGGSPFRGAHLALNECANDVGSRVVTDNWLETWGNAKKVGGREVGELVVSSGGMSMETLQNPAFSYAYETTVDNISCTTLGLPDSYHKIKYLRHASDGYGTQLAFSYGTANNRMFIRTANGMTWLPWREIGGANEALPSSQTITRNASNQVTGVSEVISGITVATTVAYNAQGNVSTVTRVSDGKTRTETYTYDAAGNITGMSATET